MSRDVSLDRMVGAVERARRHWEGRHHLARAENEDAVTAHAYTIAVSREAGTPGTLVAHELGKRLGWPVYDNELLERVAQEMGLRTELVRSVDEHHVGWLKECVNECMQAIAEVPNVSESAYVKHLLEAMFSLSAHGECVIVGRGAAQLLPRGRTVRVRLMAPLEDRIAAIRQRLGLGRRDAVKHIEQTDRDRERFIRDNFRKDPGEIHQYDVVLNTSRYSVYSCAEIIIAALRQFQAQANVAPRETPQEALAAQA
jgi:cytidylate kinase